MGMILWRFSFDGDPPAFRTIFEQVRDASTTPVRFLERSEVSVVLVGSKPYDSVGLVREGATIELHCALGAGLAGPAANALSLAGGQHPLPQADPDNPDYGEGWKGTLAEADDYVITAGDRTFRIWGPYLQPIYWCHPPLEHLEDALWEGERVSVECHALIRGIEMALTPPIDRSESPRETDDVLRALLDFLTAATSRGVASVTIRED